MRPIPGTSSYPVWAVTRNPAMDTQVAKTQTLTGMRWVNTMTIDNTLMTCTSFDELTGRFIDAHSTTLERQDLFSALFNKFTDNLVIIGYGIIELCQIA